MKSANKVVELDELKLSKNPHLPCNVTVFLIYCR